MKNNDYQIFESLVSLSQENLFKSMSRFLKKNYDNVVVQQDYMYAVGDIPIALVAHLDTVFSTPVQNLYYDMSKGVLWSPEGLGADDRAGVFAILKIIKSGLRPSVIFTTDEEKGGLGASSLAEQPCPFPGLKYMIQLDRQGWDDCVFYDCNTKDFQEYIESFGFIKDWGSFSDISFLAPAWDICAVNLSVGYIDEHSQNERLFVDSLYDTIEKVKIMLKEEEIPDFKYEELFKSYLPYNTKLKSYYEWYSDYASSDFEPVVIKTCTKCGDKCYDYEMMPVKGLDGTTKFYCPDCYSNSDNVDWCTVCYEPFERDSESINGMCKDCVKEVLAC